MWNRYFCKGSLQKIFSLFLLLLFGILPSYSQDTSSMDKVQVNHPSYRILIGTFLGNEQRNYYGNTAPDQLEVCWKLWLGKGETVISRNLGSRIWAGAGWTGQPLLYQHDSTMILVQGAYDHHLKKIDLKKHKVIWQYAFDDVVKGTGTLWIEHKDTTPRMVVFQGSRLGTGHYLDAPHVPSFRALSLTGEKELWRLDSKWTHSYSRDVDGSPLILHDTLYIGLENSLFTVINPDPDAARLKDGMNQPEILQETKLYTEEDVRNHKYNVVTESSPSRLDTMIFITSGSGHVFRYNLNKKSIDWDFYIGSDMDGSPVITRDSCILITVEQQYVPGPGGIFKLDPRKPENEAVVWFLPVDTSMVESWQGGVIGSCGINDHYISANERALGVASALDGHLYLFAHEEIDSEKMVLGPDSITYYPTPRILARIRIGPSISTPVIVGDKVVAAGYNGIRLFRIINSGDSITLQRTGFFNAPFEATPIVWDGKIYIASRNGYLYCFGKQIKSP